MKKVCLWPSLVLAMSLQRLGSRDLPNAVTAVKDTGVSERF